MDYQRETKIAWEQTDKQAEAWKYLMDNETTEVLFGGGAGGGKTLLLCGWEVALCIRYQGVRGFLGRHSLEDFKKSTLLTLFDVMNRWNLKEGRDYTHNQQDKYFHFIQSGSRIYYNELSYYPSDPDYNYLGSTEYTFAGIDEANQVNKKAKNILRSRIRYKVSENNLVPKLALTCNPDKGHLYTDFYKPWKNGVLSSDKKFVQALARDNKFIDGTYIKNLEGIDDKITKERLLFGNWEYDADPAKLMEFDAIQDLFSNILKDNKKDRFLIADVARQGKDKFVVWIWEGFRVLAIKFYEKLPLLSTSDNPNMLSGEKVINDLRTEYNVPISRVLVDEDGMGGGLKDRLGCKGFLNGSKPLRGENYANLKTQCYYLFAKKTQLREISLAGAIFDSRVRDWLIEELEQVKSKNSDRDGKLQIIGKDEVKERIGRSPDFSDAGMMRMWFDFVAVPNILWV